MFEKLKKKLFGDTFEQVGDTMNETKTFIQDGKKILSTNEGKIKAAATVGVVAAGLSIVTSIVLIVTGVKICDRLK